MLDMKAVLEANKEVSNSEKLYLYQKELNEDGLLVRILPPLEEMNGIPFVKKLTHWVDGKPLVSPESDGPKAKSYRIDPIHKILEEVKVEAKEDPDLTALLNNRDSFRAETRNYLYPCLVIDPDWTDDGVGDWKVVGKPRILEAGPQLSDAINKEITSRAARLNKTPDGPLDRETGFCVIISKKGSGKTGTEYHAELWQEPMTMDEKYYGESMINVQEALGKAVSSDQYITGVVRNYFFGDPLPEKDEWKGTAEEPEPPKKKSRPGGRPAQPKSKPAASKAATKKTASSKASDKKLEEEQPEAKDGERNLLDDLSNVSDE